MYFPWKCVLPRFAAWSTKVKGGGWEILFMKGIGSDGYSEEEGTIYSLACGWSDKTGIHLNIIGRDYERRGKWMCTPTHSWLHTPTGDPFAEIQSFVRASSGCIMDRQEDSTFAGFAEKVPEYLPIDSFDMLIDRQFSFWTDEDELRIRNREIFIYYFSDYLVRHWEVCLSLASFTTIPLFLCNPPTLAIVKYYWNPPAKCNQIGGWRVCISGWSRRYYCSIIDNVSG